MPLYEYLCRDCGYQFDAIRSIKDADQPINCKKCSSQDTQRKLSVFYAKGDSGSITHSGSSCGCGGCSGGNCSGCHH